MQTPIRILRTGVFIMNTPISPDAVGLAEPCVERHIAANGAQALRFDCIPRGET